MAIRKKRVFIGMFALLLLILFIRKDFTVSASEGQGTNTDGGTGVVAGFFYAVQKQMTILVSDNSGSTVDGASVLFQQQGGIPSTYVLLGTTDGNGKIETKLDLNTTYDFRVSKSGYEGTDLSQEITEETTAIKIILKKKKSGGGGNHSGGGGETKKETEPKSETEAISDVYPNPVVISGETKVERKPRRKTIPSGKTETEEMEETTEETMEKMETETREEKIETTTEESFPESEEISKKFPWWIFLFALIPVLTCFYLWLFRARWWLYFMPPWQDGEAYPVYWAKKNIRSYKNNMVLDCGDHIDLSDAENIITAFGKKALFRKYERKEYAEMNSRFWFETEAGTYYRYDLQSCFFLQAKIPGTIQEVRKEVIVTEPAYELAAVIDIKKIQSVLYLVTVLSDCESGCMILKGSLSKVEKKERTT